MLNIAVIGCGYWGPNIVRNLEQSSVLNLCAVSDLKVNILASIKQKYPALWISQDYRELTRSPKIDAVAIATPVASHFEIAKDALLNGKHIFIEKPFTLKSSEAKELVDLAEKKGLIIMVDHIYLFTDAVLKIKEYLSDGTLGKVYYYDAYRANLGKFQPDVSVIWDMAPHDYSVIHDLFKSKIKEVSAHGIDHFGRGLDYLAYVTLYLDNGALAHLNLNWLSPVKVRQAIIACEKKILIWDELSHEKIRIYDKGIDISNSEKEGEIIQYRDNGYVSPDLEGREALARELDYFYECVTQKQNPFNDGVAAMEVVQMLEATHESIIHNGKPVKM